MRDIKCSHLDALVGAILTRNQSDRESSNAFMRLQAKWPLASTPSNDNMVSWPCNMPVQTLRANLEPLLAPCGMVSQRTEHVATAISTSSSFVDTLVGSSRVEVHRVLEQHPGIGPKIAALVALYHYR